MKKSFILILVVLAAAGIIGVTVSSAVTSQKPQTVSNSNTVITSTTDLPDVSEDTPMRERVVVVYRDGSALPSLNLTNNDVDAGSAVSASVEVFHPANGDADALVARLKGNENVESVFIDDLVPCMAMPNDPEMNSTTNNVVASRNYTAIGADRTWNQITGNSTVKVAVIDTGCNITHEDLSGRSADVTDEYSMNSHSNDLAYHGTQVCGIIAAKANNGIGVAGMAGTANVELAPYRCGGTYKNDTNLTLSCITASLKDIENRNDIKVVNMSFGAIEGEAASETINQIKTAVAGCVAKGKIMVAAAGNNGHATSTNRNNVSYPAACDGVIAVGGVSCAGGNVAYWEGSPINSSVDVVAPAYSVRSTYTGTSDYYTNNGTSFAAPIVSGEAAMLLADNPGLTAAQVTELITSTATDMGDAGRDDAYGYGLVRFDKALAKSQNHQCGDSLYWLVSPDRKTLSVMGSGKMTNFSSADDVPWKAYSGTIETVELPEGLTNIGDFALSGMTNMTRVMIPSSVTAIGKGAFMGDSKLTALNSGENTTNDAILNIPSGIISIGEKAFSDCSALTAVSLPASTANLGTGVFDGCDNLAALTVDAESTSYVAKEGVLYNKNETELIRYPEAKTGDTFTISNSVTTIAEGAFVGVKSLNELSVPATVTVIGDNVFSDSSIQTVNGMTGSAAEIAVAKHNSANSKKITFVNENNESEIKAYPTSSLYTMTPSSVTENGNPVEVTVTPSSGMGGIVAVKYNGSTTAPTAAGSYTITIDTAASGDYIAAKDLVIGTLKIKAKAVPSSGSAGGGGGGSTPAAPQKAQPTASLYTLTPKEAKATGEPIAVSVLPSEGAGIGDTSNMTITDERGNSVAQIIEPGVYTVAVDTAETDTYAAAKGLIIGTVTVSEAETEDPQPSPDETIVPQPSPKESEIPVIYYRAHVQNIGWQTYNGGEWLVVDDNEVGTHGRSLRMEAIEIALPSGYALSGIAHVQNIGDISVVKTRQINLTGSDGTQMPYDVYFLGTTGKSLRIEAMQISVLKDGAPVDFDLSYETHVQNIGWMGFVSSGKFAGTRGRSLRMEALRMRVSGK